MTMTNENTTHFGFKKVATEEKVKLVRSVFDSVAGQYDIMNDLMSMGIHRIWKRVAVQLSNVRKGEQVLDLAGGTGDLTTLFEQRVGKEGQVVLADIMRDTFTGVTSQLLFQIDVEFSEQLLKFSTCVYVSFDFNFTGEN